MNRIDDAMVAATMRGYDRNNLFAFVAAIIGSEEAQRLMEMYRVGTSKHWQGATVFWQISADGNVRGGKIMLYDRLTGHRVQEPFPHINWVHSVLRLPDFKLTQCLVSICSHTSATNRLPLWRVKRRQYSQPITSRNICGSPQAASAVVSTARQSRHFEAER